MSWGVVGDYYKDHYSFRFKVEMKMNIGNYDNTAVGIHDDIGCKVL